MPIIARSAPWDDFNSAAAKAYSQGDIPGAIVAYQRALAAAEAAHDPDTKIANTLLDLARVYSAQGQYAQVEPLIQRARALYTRALGADHPYTAIAAASFAALWVKEGKYEAAEREFAAAQAVLEKDPKNEGNLATVLNNRADLALRSGELGQAEDLQRRSLALREKLYGLEAPQVATSLSNLGLIYEAQSREDDAEKLYLRALAIRTTGPVPNRRGAATALGNLSVLYSRQGRLDDALTLRQRATALEGEGGAGSELDLARSLNNLGVLESRMGRPAASEADHRQALAIRERRLGERHPDVALSLNNLAASLKEQAKRKEAEALYRRALTLREDVLGPEHPEVVSTLGNLAVLLHEEKRDTESLALIRRANRIAGARIGAARADELSRSRESETFAEGYIFQVELLAATGATNGPAGLDEAFQAAQASRSGGNAGVLARMAARFAAGDDDLGRAVRERQDQIARARWLQSEIIDAAAAPAGARTAGQEQALRTELAALTARIGAGAADLQQRFPEYQALASATPAGIPEVQALLRPGEALMAYLVDSDATWLWVVQPDKAGFVKLAIGRSALEKTVASLRRQLDPSAGVLRDFSDEEAHALYRQVFAPAEPLLAGAREILLVPDGALLSLPFGVMMTAPPAENDARNKNYGAYRWLADQYAFTTLPAESSLRALRRFAGRAAGERPFTGFGDPMLKGDQQPGSRGLTPARMFGRGTVADVRMVNSLAPLPETADELRRLAGILGDPKDVYLGTAATETAVKRADLSRVRTLAFATHGLMAGDFQGLGEPALALTPPVTPSAADDGLLTASEVALLKLNADWVILSACNTAAPDGSPGAEGLSGLARAFFYAGGRSLLVSHWPVASQAAVRLTTGTLKAYADGASKAQALKRAMAALRADPSNPEFAHPGIWGPFVVVGGQ